jgi:hypothetical protein
VQWAEVNPAAAGAEAVRDGPQVCQHGPGVITPAQPSGPKVGNFHWIACKFNRKRVEIIWNREAKGPGGPLAPLSYHPWHGRSGVDEEAGDDRVPPPALLSGCVR